MLIPPTSFKINLDMMQYFISCVVVIAYMGQSLFATVGIGNESDIIHKLFIKRESGNSKLGLS